MSRLDILSLEPSDAKSQSSFFIDLFQESAKKVPRVIELAKLPLEQLLILQVLKDIEEAGAKFIEQKVTLSRSAILAHTKKLVELKYIIQKEVRTAKTGIKATYIFSIADGFPIDLIDEAIEYNIKKKNRMSDSVVESFFSRISSEDDSAQEPDIFFAKLKHHILQLPAKTQEILKIIPPAGITTVEMAALLSCDSSTAYKHLQYLLNEGWLTRQTAASRGMGRNGYAYFLPTGITVELVNALLDSDNPTKLNNYAQNLENSNKSDEIQVNNEVFMQEKAFWEQAATKPIDASVTVEKLDQIADKLEKLMILADQFEQLSQEIRELMGTRADKLIARIKSRMS
ncbi:MAG: hypothetical protein RMX63_34660 [Aulosira sp. ZfuCHP01]|nr:hypothetical protein [Aulosira sp. ZfuCHP01]